MRRKCAMALFTAALLASVVPPAVPAAGQYKPCSLLTPAEVEAVLGAKVAKTSDAEGTYKGQTMATCSWATDPSGIVTVAGKIGATLTITRGSGSPEAVWSAEARKLFDFYKQKGWTVEYADARGAVCARAVPPAGEASSLPFSACAAESKGLSLSLNVVSRTVKAQQARGLFDKAVARLR